MPKGERVIGGASLGMQLPYLSDGTQNLSSLKNINRQSFQGKSRKLKCLLNFFSCAKFFPLELKLPKLKSKTRG